MQRQFRAIAVYSSRKRSYSLNCRRSLQSSTIFQSDMCLYHSASVAITPSTSRRIKRRCRCCGISSTVRVAWKFVATEGMTVTRQQNASAAAMLLAQILKTCNGTREHYCSLIICCMQRALEQMRLPRRLRCDCQQALTWRRLRCRTDVSIELTWFGWSSSGL